MALNHLVNFVQEIIGIFNRSEAAAETGVYVLPRWYRGLKVCFAIGFGLFVTYWTLSIPDLLAGKRIVGLIAGAGCEVLGIRIARGIRVVTVAGGVVSAEFGGGRRESWPIRNLVAPGPNLLIGGPVRIRVRGTGRVAFVVPRDLPAWEVLVASISTARDA